MQTGKEGKWQRTAVDSPRNTAVAKLFQENAKSLDQRLDKALKIAPSGSRGRKAAK